MIVPGRCWPRGDLPEATVPEPKKGEPAAKPDELLDALQRLKDAEERKRREPISSDRFHELAHEVDALSHEVFWLARDQRGIGDETDRADETIEDVDAELKRR